MPQFLNVLANPFAAPLDHEGRCHGHVQYEPDPRGGDANLRWVGCRVKATQTRKADPSQQIAEDWDHAWVYDPTPTSVPVTQYYLQALRQGDLLCADVETQDLAFGSRDGFIDPLKRIAQFAAERKATPLPDDEKNDRGDVVKKGWPSWLADAAKVADTPTSPQTPLAKGIATKTVPAPAAATTTKSDSEAR